MGIVVFAVFGLIVGFIARGIMPGRQSLGLVATALLGMAGSLIGGLAGSAIFGPRTLELHAAGAVGSLVGALAILALAGLGGRGGITT